MGKRVGVRAPLKQPRAETDSHLISLACAVGSDEASRLAIEDMLDWLADLRPALERRDAYLMLSVAADVRITQVRPPTITPEPPCCVWSCSLTRSAPFAFVCPAPMRT